MSIFKTTNQWPPAKWKSIYDLFIEHDAWYSGDPIKLSNLYQGKAGPFWGTVVPAGERKIMMHIPVATDIARTSARLLFGEHPKLRIPEAYQSNASSDAKQAQKRLDELIEMAGIYHKLSEAAESAAAMGGVFLKIDWDKSIANYPLLNIVQADNAIPDYRLGILQSVIFHQVLMPDDSNDTSIVWRHIERRERGKITTELWRGSLTSLGTQMPLTARPETANMEPVVGTDIDDILCRYIPNMLPHPRYRGLNIGQSDFLNCEGMMDSLDQAWSSWMRDIELGLGRLIADKAFFQKDPTDGTFKFDLQKEAYLGLSAVTGVGALKDQLVVNQFAIRADEHSKTVTDLMRTIFGMAGYAPQTFGLDIQGNAPSGTALRTQERKSLLTAATKADYWIPALQDIMELMLQIDRLVFRSGITVFKPNASLGDSIQNDPLQTATSVEMLNRAQAASIETRVRLTNPDWDTEQVLAEVQRIQEETGQSVLDPIQIGQA